MNQQKHCQSPTNTSIYATFLNSSKTRLKYIRGTWSSSQINGWLILRLPIDVDGSLFIPTRCYFGLWYFALHTLPLCFLHWLMFESQNFSDQVKNTDTLSVLFCDSSEVSKAVPSHRFSRLIFYWVSRQFSRKFLHIFPQSVYEWAMFVILLCMPTWSVHIPWQCWKMV